MDFENKNVFIVIENCFENKKQKIVAVFSKKYLAVDFINNIVIGKSADCRGMFHIDEFVMDTNCKKEAITESIPEYIN